MGAYVIWYNQRTDLPPLNRSGIAHLYFESIHPFDEGNGRIGRAISEKVLSQSLKRPTWIAISSAIEKEKSKGRFAYPCTRTVFLRAWTGWGSDISKQNNNLKINYLKQSLSPNTA